MACLLVLDGIAVYDSIIPFRNEKETYPLTSHNDTQDGFRFLIQACFDLATTIQMPIPWWSAVRTMDWPVIESHLHLSDVSPEVMKAELPEEEPRVAAAA